MKFTNGGSYKGQFIGDQADGVGQYEDIHGNLFQVEQGVEKDGRDGGCIVNCRLQNLCSVQFNNGEKFKGIYKDGRPNGKGEVFYKNSIKSCMSGVEYEQAKYKGNFVNGKREGFGKLVWQDGSCFEGQWKNDMRLEGRMVMANGCVYIGKFKNDKFHGKNE